MQTTVQLLSISIVWQSERYSTVLVAYEFRNSVSYLEELSDFRLLVRLKSQVPLLHLGQQCLVRLAALLEVVDLKKCFSLCYHYVIPDEWQTDDYCTERH